MCLVLALTNTKKIKLSQCLNDIGNTLLKSADDGFGYAIQGRDGVFGEKTIAKQFRTRLGRPNHIQLPIVKKKYMSFGTPTELVGPGIFHGRNSTNTVGLSNTHPMIMSDDTNPQGNNLWYLIHNGVVQDWGPDYVKNCDNDSEDVLRRLLDGVGKVNPMEDIEKHLEGYYAFAAIDTQGRLHIARDMYATLFMAWSSKLETFIIGTTEGLILKVSKILDAKIGPIDEIEDETYCIFNGNDLIHCQDFTSRGYTSRQSAWASESLGRTLAPGAQVCGLTPSREVIDVGNGGLKDVSGAGARATAQRVMNELSEADWQDNIMDFFKSSQHPDRSNRVSEDSYYKYKNEVDNMDASYQIYTLDDTPITLADFRKLDHVQQEMCTIIRSDGTVVDPEDYGTPRLSGRGRHASE